MHLENAFLDKYNTVSGTCIHCSNKKVQTLKHVTHVLVVHVHCFHRTVHVAHMYEIAIHVPTFPIQ